MTTGTERPLRIQINPEEGVSLRADLGDGRSVDFLPMIFTWRLAVGPTGEHTYNEFWCFKERWQAIAAFLLFAADPSVEPEGWVKHVPSHRRRRNGDPATEWVEP